MTERSYKEIAAALCKAQASMPDVLKTADNPFYKSKYADLSGIWKTIKGTLTDNGLSVVQASNATDGGTISITTILLHTSGEYIESTMVLKPKDATPQGCGSAITYARRYALCALVGVCPEGEDDDGNAASAEPNKAAKAAKGFLETKAGVAPKDDLAKFRAVAMEIAARDLGGLGLSDSDILDIGRDICMNHKCKTRDAATAWLKDHGQLSVIENPDTGEIAGIAVKARETVKA